MSTLRMIWDALKTDVSYFINSLHDAIVNYPNAKDDDRRKITSWILTIAAITFVIVFSVGSNSKSFDFFLGGLLAVIAGFLGSQRAGELQIKRDKVQKVQDIGSLRKAIRSEISDLWETYKEQVGNTVEKHDQMKNPYSPERGYVPSLRHCPVLTGVASRVGILNLQELSWINRTYAALSQLQNTFEIVEKRRREQETKPLGNNIRNYDNVLATREKHARQNIHALQSASLLWVTTTLSLLDRPLDKQGNPIGPGPFEDDS